MQRKEYSPLLKWAGRSLKYYALLLLCFGVACILPILLGAPDITHLLMSSLGFWLWRIAALVFVFLIITVVLESIRS